MIYSFVLPRHLHIGRMFIQLPIDGQSKVIFLILDLFFIAIDFFIVFLVGFLDSKDIRVVNLVLLVDRIACNRFTLHVDRLWLCFGGVGVAV